MIAGEEFVGLQLFVDRSRDQNPPRPRVRDFGPAAKKHTKSSISIKLYSRYHFIKNALQ